MLASSFLDTAIGIIFVFLLLSIIASTVNEIILSLLNLRGRLLLDGLKTLLNDPDATGLVKELYNHGQIFGLFQGTFNPSAPRRLPWNKPKPAAGAGGAGAGGAGGAGVGGAAEQPPGDKTQRNLPSYIPVNNFVSAFLDILVDKAGAAQPQLKTNLDNAKQAAGNAVVAAKQANDNASNVLLNAGTTQAEKDAARQAAVASQAAADLAKINLNIERFRLMKAYAQTLAETNDKVGKPLVAMLETAQTDIDKLQQSIESWYNGAMDRVSGWYKYNTQWVLFWIGLVLAISLNANTITIIKQISTNDAVRQSLVAAAAKAPAPSIPATNGQPDTTQKSHDTSGTKPADPPASPAKNATASGQQGSTPDNANPSPQNPADASFSGSSSSNSAAGGQTSQSGVTGDSGAAKPAPTLKDIADQVSQVTSLGLPIGWQSTPFVWWAPLGWLLTAVGVSLGAPFWFDLLNKFMVVRSTVKPQEKSKEEGSKDKQ